MFVERWGKDCLPLRKACIDQGTVVVYEPLHDGTWPIKNFQLDFNHLDFRGFGDVIGIISYPTPIIRPGTREEEAADLSSPVFSNCSRPVVLYHNHLFMFGDFMIRLMPTYINAIKAATWPPEHNPAWDSRLSLVLATGGQKMARWQKLMMAPLSQQPIVTLSEASSRAIPLMHPPHQQQHDLAVASAAAGTQQQKQYLPDRQLQEDSRDPASSLKPLSLTTKAVPMERCFESLTLCSLNNPRGFPSSTDRPVWSGAQFIKDFWMQHYGTAYSYLLPHQQALQQPGAFRVVFAIRSEAEVSATANYSQTDFAVLDHTDVLVGLHGAQLMNAFFMPAHKSLVEIRPYNFNLGWPSIYFREPMVEDDKGEGIFWFGVNTIQKNNSLPGMWEAVKRGCCYERDRHTRIEYEALDYLFR
eukprot:gene6871-7087_t